MILNLLLSRQTVFVSGNTMLGQVFELTGKIAKCHYLLLSLIFSTFVSNAYPELCLSCSRVCSLVSGVNF